MKLKKFKDAVKKGYETSDLEQAHAVFYTRNYSDGTICGICPVTAALLGLGYDVTELIPNRGAAIGIKLSAMAEFNMSEKMIQHIFDLNDIQQLDWRVLLEQLK